MDEVGRRWNFTVCGLQGGAASRAVVFGLSLYRPQLVYE